ncbi:MAG: PAS domain S-box protein, partial [Planctomycetes bacterium]|nr:PAS domain S-box protein [Planctomycetota bacterium]
MPHKQAWNGVEDQYRLLARSIQDLAIFLLDPQGMVTSWNPGAEQFFGYREEEALGMPFSGLFTAEDIEQGVPEQELQTAQGKGRVSGNRWLIRKDGTCLWVKGTTTSLRDEEGHLRGFAKICHDLTERKRLEEALRNADRRKDEFLAMLAHELRDPLAPIRNSVQVLRQPGTAEADVQRSLDLIDRQVRHLNRLVDDLLDVSRISRGQLRLQKRPVELPTVVAQAVETCRPLIDAQHHQLHVDIHPVLQVRADPTRLTQVLVNLLTNAARYTPEGGHLRLALEQSGPEVVVRVKDDGIGIRPEMLPHIFDLYNQAAPEWHHSQGGLGIGLTLVKRLVELHGGRVEAFSDGPGRGAEFVVQLPHLQEIPMGETRPEPGEPLPS